MSATTVAEPTDPAVAFELWSSFVSLLRSYAAAHSLNGTRQAVLEVSDDHLLMRAAERWLAVSFSSQRGTIARETGATCEFTIDDDGRIRIDGATDEMDMVAERLARELLR